MDLQMGVDEALSRCAIAGTVVGLAVKPRNAALRPTLTG